MEKTPKFAKGPVINSRDKGKASTINLIGERHSGTNWITDHLVDCFGEQIQVSVIVCAVYFWWREKFQHSPMLTSCVIFKT